MSEEKKGFFARLKEGLTKTRDNIVRGIDSVFSGFSAIDDDFYEELEEILIMGDIGVNATTAIVERLKQQVKEKHIKEPSECKQLLIESIKEQMQVDETAYDFEKEQSVIMVMLYGIICGNYAQYGLMSAATSIPVVVGGMLVIRLVASRVVHTAFWSTAGSWVCSICLSAGPVSALHLLWLTS